MKYKYIIFALSIVLLYLLYNKYEPFTDQELETKINSIISKLDSIKERTTTLHVALPRPIKQAEQDESTESDELLEVSEPDQLIEVSEPVESTQISTQVMPVSESNQSDNVEENACPSGMVYNSQGECVKILPLYEIIQGSSLKLSNNKAHLENKKIVFNESDISVVYAEFVAEFSKFYMKINDKYLKLTDTSTKSNMSFELVSSKENATVFDALNINKIANEKYKVRQDLDLYVFKPESYTGYCTTVPKHEMKCTRVPRENTPISHYIAVYTYFKKVT
jgi:uncharacterized protein YfbU (UPF0304 family)